MDIGFDINGTKHLDASLGYAIKKFPYGYTFSPQMHLIVNNERVAALSGLTLSIRLSSITWFSSICLTKASILLKVKSETFGKAMFLSAI